MADDGRGDEQDRPGKGRWHDNCDCGDPCSGVDCVPDCVPCDLNLTLLGLIALSRPGRSPRARPTLPARAGAAAIRGYQRWLSPRLPTACRHTPTCSEYGLISVRRYGLAAGSRLTAARLRRCNATVARGTANPVP